jgi:cycloisomaltooligosaccharide glucanotransferase 2
MLDNEFFVNSGRSMSPDLQAWMKNYYNISTAYENLLYGDHLTRQERQVEVSTAGVSLPTSTDGSANTIWANTMTSDAGTALHLINLRTNDQDGNDEYWRNAAKQTLPFGDTSVTYHLAGGEPAPASVFVVSPDNDGGRPTQLDVTLGTDEQGNATVTFNVGWLSTWDMVVFSPTKDADRAGTEASANEAVTGQVRNGLGQCLSAQDAQAANGTPVWNSDCDAQGTAEQTVTYQDNHLMIGGRCVDVLANGTADGSVVHLWDCYPTLPSQQWDRNDAGQYVNRGSGTCLTIPNDTTTTSTQAIIAQCSSSSPSQRWSAPVPAGQ